MSTPDRILVIEDNVINAELARFVLDTHGFVVELAFDGKQALAAVRDFRPSLILMDLQLPDIGGLELTRRVRFEPAYRDMIIIAFSAQSTAQDDSEAIPDGFDGRLSKPIDFKTFAASVAGFLRTQPSLG